MEGGRSPQRSRRSQQRHIVVGHGSFQADCWVPDRTDPELAQEVLQHQGQLRDPDDQVRYAGSNQSLQLPSNSVPRHRHTVMGHERSLHRSCRPQQRRTVVGQGGLRVDGSAPEQAGVELRQEILQQHGQLHDPYESITHPVSSHLLQLPSNALPQHRHTIGGDRRSPQRPRPSQQRHTGVGHGRYQADCSVPDQADSEPQQEVLQQQGQLQDPDVQVTYAVNNQSLQLQHRHTH